MILFLVFIFLCVGESLTSDIQCNSFNNEEASCVPKCPPEPTCQNRKIQYSCLANQKCVQKCKCKAGFFRNSVGLCITEKDCERCNEKRNEYYECGGFCDNVCAELRIQNKTNCPVQNIKCNEKCYCKDGYARNSKNICIPISQCFSKKSTVHRRCTRYTKSPLCNDPNEVFNSCTKSCPPDKCFSLVAKFKCDSNEVCKPGCRCKSGYLRKKAGSPCIPIRQCPELANSPDFNG